MAAAISPKVCIFSFETQKGSVSYEIPIELVLFILKKLDVKTIGSIALINKALNHACNKKHLWTYLFKRDMGPKAQPDLSSGWKEAYKIALPFYRASINREIGLVIPNCQKQ